MSDSVECHVSIMMDTLAWRDLPISQAEFDPSNDTLIRQSIIGNCQLCEYREKLKSHPDYEDTSNFSAAFFGTCVHYLIEHDLRVGEPRLDLLTTMNEWVENLLQEQYDWTLSKVPEVRNLFAEVTTAYRQWRTNVRPTFGDPVGVEEEIYLRLGDGERGGLYLKGSPDTILDDVILDWKTTGRAWNPGKAHMSIQASLYMALVKQEFNMPIRKFKFWIFNKGSREWECILTERRVKDINAALHTATDYANKLEKGTFTATPVAETFGKKKRGWYCSAKWCGAWNVCPIKYMADEVDEKEIAIKGW